MEAKDEAAPDERRSHERFMRLFLQSERELLRYVMAIVPQVGDARDVLQEAAVSLWAKFDQYDPAKPFVAWACRFALYEAKQFLRSEGRRKAKLAGDVVELLAERRRELDDDLNARLAHLPECLEKLPAPQKALLRGYYFDEESVEALAKKFDRSFDTVYKTLQRARAALAECIQGKLRVSG